MCRNSISFYELRYAFGFKAQHHRVRLLRAVADTQKKGLPLLEHADGSSSKIRDMGRGKPPPYPRCITELESKVIGFRDARPKGALSFLVLPHQELKAEGLPSLRLASLARQRALVAPGALPGGLREPEHAPYSGAALNTKATPQEVKA